MDPTYVGDPCAAARDSFRRAAVRSSPTLRAASPCGARSIAVAVQVLTAPRNFLTRATRRDLCRRETGRPLACGPAACDTIPAGQVCARVDNREIERRRAGEGAKSHVNCDRLKPLRRVSFRVRWLSPKAGIVRPPAPLSKRRARPEFSLASACKNSRRFSSKSSGEDARIRTKKTFARELLARGKLVGLPRGAGGAKLR